MLIGCWKPQQIRIWSLGYFRFWLVKTLVRLNPIVLFAGSPIFIFYLRALGAKIGRGVVILSPQIPVCTDLLTIGDNTVVRKDSFFSCYSAHDGVIHTGPVTIGKDAFVGEMTVLEIGSSLGDGAQLGHSSSLHAGQSVPKGEHRCGSPARQRTEVDYREVDPAECGTSRKIAYSAFVLLNGFMISAFLMSAAIMLRPMIAARPHSAVPGSLAFSHWTFYGDALIISLLLFVGTILFGLLYVVTVPRLLATKVMVPVEGDVREGVGLLGSPSFEIPRSVRRDIELGQPEDGEEQDRKLAAKNKHNLVTVGLFLLAEWILSFLMVLLFLGAVNLYLTVGVSALALALMLALFIRAGYHVLVERASTLFQVLQPQQCSIYDPYFWYHERFWKLTVLPSHLTIFDGTPLKSFAWRLLGVRIGKRVFDDGCDISEKTLVAIGDGCTLNSGSIIQPHSQEDGGFKSDSITIGAGCTLGVNSWVHYGVTMGDGAHLGSHAFLMKGAEVPPHARWWDNPANQVQIDYFAEAAMVAVTPPSPTATNTATSVSGG